MLPKPEPAMVHYARGNFVWRGRVGTPMNYRLLSFAHRVRSLEVEVSCPNPARYGFSLVEREVVLKPRLQQPNRWSCEYTFIGHPLVSIDAKSQSELWSGYDSLIAEQIGVSSNIPSHFVEGMRLT